MIDDLRRRVKALEEALEKQKESNSQLQSALGIFLRMRAKGESEEKEFRNSLYNALDSLSRACEGISADQWPGDEEYT